MLIKINEIMDAILPQSQNKKEGNIFKAGIERKDILLVFLMLICAMIAFHGMLLTNRSIIWDGLLWHHLLKVKDYTTHFWAGFQMGRFDGIYIGSYIYNNFDDYLFAFRTCNFLMIFLSSLAIFYISYSILEQSLFTSFISFCLFCAQPFCDLTPDFAIMVNYIYLALFLVGNSSLARFFFQKESSLLAVIISLLLCRISFTMSSLLVMEGPIILFFGLAAYRDKRKVIPLVILIVTILFVFFTSRKPFGIYEGYNQINPDFFVRSIGISIIEILRVFKYTVQKLPFPDITSFLFGSFMSIFLGLGIFYFKKNIKSYPESHKSLAFSIVLLVFSILLSFCAIFPYVVVGKFPRPYTVDSRNAILFTCSIPFLYIGFRSLLKYIPLRINIQLFFDRAVLAIIVAMVFINVTNYVEWDFDNYKRHAFISVLKDNISELEKCDLIAFGDKTTLKNKENRAHLDVYEWASYLSDVMGSEKMVVGLDIADARKNSKNLNELRSKNKREFENMSRIFIASDYAGGDRPCEVVFYNKGIIDRTLSSYLEMKKNELFMPEKMQEQIKFWFSARISRTDFQVKRGVL
ncbi:MAG: hypothetical protein HQK54_00870 [Oligoflexales bacterium]|nr:hypothetical protein [Oligoflexales bacterium]